MSVYRSDFYNEIRGDEQWIRLTDGCYRNCWNCLAPQQKIVYNLPDIKRNKVRFLDMNFLYAHHSPVGLLNILSKQRVNKKVVYYTFLCGLDFTLIEYEVANALKKARFGRFNNKGNFVNGLQLAWDRTADEEEKFKKCIEVLNTVGYRNRNIQVFMLCNGRVPYAECLCKLKVLSDLNIQVCDCWYDNQKRGSIEPMFSWTQAQCKLFGSICRAHNISVLQRQIEPLKILFNARSKK